jgi:hypothetical protein
VVDVDRGDAAILELVQQDDRIDAAGEADGDLPSAARESLNARPLP